MSENTAPAVQTPTERMVAMLMDPHAVFDRSQAAFLMAAAAKWSAEAARAEVSELNLEALARAYAEPAFSQAEVLRAERRKQARAEHDIAAGFPHLGDYPGGAVPDWEYEPGR